MSLKRIIKPEELENHIAEIKMPKPIGVQVLDATRTMQDYQNDIFALRRRFGETLFNGMVDKANQMVCASEKQREAAQAAKLAQVPEPNHLLNYAHALASNDPLAKNEFLEHQSIETLNTILKEISGKERHYNSVFKYQVGFAIETLRYYIATHPAQKPSLVERVKNAIGVQR